MKSSITNIITKIIEQFLCDNKKNIVILHYNIINIIIIVL